VRFDLVVGEGPLGVAERQREREVALVGRERPALVGVEERDRFQIIARGAGGRCNAASRPLPVHTNPIESAAFRPDF
jgi:hypothetical protein